MDRVIFYFAYGSNLHPLRFKERISSGEFVQRDVLDRYILKFHKVSQDGSGKANALHTGNARDQVPGVIYKMDAGDLENLDRWENRYWRKEIQLKNFDGEVSTYFAHPDRINPSLQTYTWYRDTLLEGAKYYCFPEEYIAQISEVDAWLDPDAKKSETQISLKQRIKNYSQNYPFHNQERP